MQKCYNCGKEVDDNVLICPECGALVKRYGKPEPQQAEPFESQGTAFTQPPQPHAAVWQREDGKLKFSGGVTFWLVLCAIFLGYTLLGFACTLFIYRFQAAYFQTISQFQELAPLAELPPEISMLLPAQLRPPPIPAPSVPPVASTSPPEIVILLPLAQ